MLTIMLMFAVTAYRQSKLNLFVLFVCIYSLFYVLHISKFMLNWLYNSINWKDCCPFVLLVHTCSVVYILCFTFGPLRSARIF